MPYKIPDPPAAADPEPEDFRKIRAKEALRRAIAGIHIPQDGPDFTGGDKDFSGRPHKFVYILCRCKTLGNGDHSCFGARRQPSRTSSSTARFRDLGQ